MPEQAEHYTSEEGVKKITNRVFKDTDFDGDGFITAEEFEKKHGSSRRDEL